jgi:glycerol-3-phosphate acyltransferase PlsY
VEIALAAVVGYLLGSFPSADLVTRIATRGRVDIRTVGSGNPGTLNAIQSIGIACGLAVLVLDLAKGLAAGVVGRAVGGDVAGYVGATAAITGHILPVWTRFRGGKGVATSAGACIAVFPAYVPIDLVVAFLGAARSQQAAVATRIACAVWVVAAAAWWGFGWSNLWGPAPSGWLLGFALVGSALILGAFERADRATRRAAA